MTVYVEDDKKVLCQVLGRVYLPETVDDDKIRTLKLLVHNVFTVRPLFLPVLITYLLTSPFSAPPHPRCLGTQRTDQIRRRHQQEIR